MTTRITGLATGLDVDTIVKQTMQAYRTKIDTQQQKKDVTEIKQQLYRDLIKEAQELYNTHFDVLKSGSLVRASTWQSVKFDSEPPNLVTVTGDASATLGNYTVDKESVIAKAANITKLELDKEITINGENFKIKEGVSKKEQAIDLNNQLTKAGINVSVKYTGFVGNKDGGFLFESKTLGANSNFVIGTGKETTITKIGEDAKGAKITGLTVSDLKSNIDTTINSELGDDNSMGKVVFKIGSDEFTIDISSATENEDLEKILNAALSKKGYTAKIQEDNNIIFNTTKTGSEITDPKTIQVKEGSLDSYIDITNFKFTDGIDAKLPQDLSIGNLDGINQIYINGVYINFKDIQPGKEDNKITIEDKIEYINKALDDNKISSVIASKDASGNMVLKSNIVGANSKIEFCNLSGVEMSAGGKDAKITISNGTGTFIHEGNSNTFTVDGITFKFTGDIPEEGIKVSSKQNSTEIIDKIKSYIDDYNKLIVKINTLTSEKRDRNYQPLTKDQKSEMSDKEIELWEAKVKQGQLRNDSDLTRIANSLRQDMSVIVSGVGLTLKDIGIESVQDYGGNKDGTFKVNEATLKEAIENNTEEVSKLFIQSASSGTSENDAYSKKGIMMRLKEILYDETVSSKSVLAKKVGFEGTTTVANNTLTKQMTEYQKKIDQMENLFSNKEQDLYTKYAKLETIMNSYNSQMTYLSQSLGLSS